MYLFVYLNIFTFGFKYFAAVDVGVDSLFFLLSFAPSAPPAPARLSLSLAGVTTKTLSSAEGRSSQDLLDVDPSNDEELVDAAAKARSPRSVDADDPVGPAPG